MKSLDEKLKALENILSGYDQMLIALSGGVDSVFLLAFAYRLRMNDSVAALTASGPHFADDEVAYAEQLCDNLGISHKTLSVDHVLPMIADNPADRCYICKREIFSLMKERADMVGSVLMDGTNLDDTGDYRPGTRALEELGVISPLKEAELTKAEIREALKDIAEKDDLFRSAFMTDIWNKPAFACLASRIPYGERITEEKLSAVYRAESYLRGLGFAQVRVRHHGDVARIEVLPEDREKFYDTAFMDTVNAEITKCGFKFAALDLGGYKMGNLNNRGNGTDKK